jgi:tripartite-type tricarboxylate transporter receptor subunit TctC
MRGRYLLCGQCTDIGGRSVLRTIATTPEIMDSCFALLRLSTGVCRRAAALIGHGVIQQVACYDSLRTTTDGAVRTAAPREEVVAQTIKETVMAHTCPAISSHTVTSHMVKSRKSAFAAVALVGTTALASPAAADSVADFYAGKTITILMGTGPGGSFDLYGRLIAQYYSKHIPGNPNFIVEHMPGHGGANAANHVYGVAAQDGTEILLSHAIPLAEKLEAGSGIKFESRKMHWLGAYDAIAQSMTVWHTAPAKTLDDLKTKDMTIGAFNKNHLTYQWAALTKDVLGTKYKIVAGYRSGADCNIAMERGEIAGWVASWENIIGTRPQWIKEKKVRMLVQYTLERQQDLQDVPTLLELAPPDKRDLVDFIVAGTPISRAMAVGPGVPADRVAALRKGFDALMKDPEFLADAKKRNLHIHPRDAKATHALVDKIIGASPELVNRVAKAIGMQTQAKL